MIRRPIMLATIGLMLAGSGAANAYNLERVNHDPCVTTDQNLFWKNARATVDTSFLLPSSFIALGNQAFTAWNTDLARFRFVPGRAAGFCDNTDRVVSLGASTSVCDGSAFDPDTLGVALTFFNSVTGEIRDSDITFNASKSFSDPEFLEVAIHELGHSLGLDHSDLCGGSGHGTVMNSTLETGAGGTFFTAPQADDINGGNVIYPAASPTPTASATSTRTPSGSPATATITPTPTSTRTASTPRGTPTFLSSPTPEFTQAHHGSSGGGCDVTPADDPGGRGFPALLLIGGLLVWRRHARRAEE